MIKSWYIIVMASAIVKKGLSSYSINFWKFSGVLLIYFMNIYLSAIHLNFEASVSFPLTLWE